MTEDDFRRMQEHGEWIASARIHLEDHGPAAARAFIGETLEDAEVRDLCVTLLALYSQVMEERRGRINCGA